MAEEPTPIQGEPSPPAEQPAPGRAGPAPVPPVIERRRASSAPADRVGATEVDAVSPLVMERLVIMVRRNRVGYAGYEDVQEAEWVLSREIRPPEPGLLGRLARALRPHRAPETDDPTSG